MARGAEYWAWDNSLLAGCSMGSFAEEPPALAFARPSAGATALDGALAFKAPRSPSSLEPLPTQHGRRRCVAQAGHFTDTLTSCNRLAVSRHCIPKASALPDLAL